MSPGAGIVITARYPDPFLRERLLKSSREAGKTNYRFVKINFLRRQPEGIFAPKLKNHQICPSHMDLI
jgi:hypothetical protein